MSSKYTVNLDGVLLLDKPAGISSHGAISRIKYQHKLKKIGHAGTLDPLATGLLIVLVGKATKSQSEFLNSAKSYEGEILLGTKTATDDLEGEAIEIDSEKKYLNTFASLTDQELEKYLEEIRSKFLGKISQIPPNFSAIKVSGKRSYKMARKGEDFQLEPREVEILGFTLKYLGENLLNFQIHCSKGTYIRSIARDIGKEFGTVSCLYRLRRTGSGDLSIQDAFTLDQVLAEQNLESILS